MANLGCWVSTSKPSHLRDPMPASSNLRKSCLETEIRMHSFVRIMPSHGRGGKDDRDRMSPAHCNNVLPSPNRRKSSHAPTATPRDRACELLRRQSQSIEQHVDVMVHRAARPRRENARPAAPNGQARRRRWVLSDQSPRW